MIWGLSRSFNIKNKFKALFYFKEMKWDSIRQIYIIYKKKCVSEFKTKKYENLLLLPHIHKYMVSVKVVKSHNDMVEKFYKSTYCVIFEIKNKNITHLHTSIKKNEKTREKNG